MFDEKSYSLKMDKAIEVFSKELSSLRTGRANASMLDLIKVDVYGQQMPINQVGSITTPDQGWLIFKYGIQTMYLCLMRL